MVDIASESFVPFDALSNIVSLGVINTIAKLAKACTLRLTTDKLYFILSDKVANGGVSMWCELSQVRMPLQKQ